MRHFPIHLALPDSRPRRGEPLSFGVPLPRGAVHDAREIGFVCEERAHVTPAGIPPAGIFREPGARRSQTRASSLEAALPCQVEVLSRWQDGSVRFALLDTLVDRHPDREFYAAIAVGEGTVEPSTAVGGLRVHDEGRSILVDTGSTCFRFERGGRAPFVCGVDARGREGLLADARLLLTDERGQGQELLFEEIDIEARGPVRATIRGRGTLRKLSHAGPIRFAVRVSMWAGRGLARLELSLTNGSPALHPGGVWDLGDPASLRFESLELLLLPRGPVDGEITWRVAPDLRLRSLHRGSVRLEQMSSGGDNWQSRNHVHRNGEVLLPFRGCRIRQGTLTEMVDRASPSWMIPTRHGNLAVAMPFFWQNFPKSVHISIDGSSHLGIFPSNTPGAQELQGGEKTTHIVWIELAHRAEPTDVSTVQPDASACDLSWTERPLVPTLDPEHWKACSVFSRFFLASEDPDTRYAALVSSVLEGPDNWFGKREVIDEYGWRNFGDVWADHEGRYRQDDAPIISHYNNQYDVLLGLLLHFARSGDRRWFELARDLASHVCDIDLYHTTEDRAAYNGGLFWHTDHFEDAGRGTHRCYTKDSPLAAQGKDYGGGPSSAHNYSTGLLWFHWLTGSPDCAAAVRGLADWVIAQDDGRNNILGAFCDSPTGFATAASACCELGRCAGNSVSCLLDAHGLTGEPHYLQKAEEFIRRSIHPLDDVEAMGLDVAVTKWSYLVFLQALIKFLDRKIELRQVDAMYSYSRASLLRYATWIRDCEQSYNRLYGGFVRSQTWSVQDLRKSCVLRAAAEYLEPGERSLFLDRAEYFYRQALTGLESFGRPLYTRPQVLLMVLGMQAMSRPGDERGAVRPKGREFDHGVPSRFIPQRQLVRQQLLTPGGLARALWSTIRLRPLQFLRRRRTSRREQTP